MHGWHKKEVGESQWPRQLVSTAADGTLDLQYGITMTL